MKKLLLLTVMIGFAWSSQALELVKDGKAAVSIYVAADAAKETAEGAQDLARAFKIMSGAEIPVVQVKEAKDIDAGKTGTMIVAFSLVPSGGRASREDGGVADAVAAAADTPCQEKVENRFSLPPVETFALSLCLCFSLSLSHNQTHIYLVSPLSRTQSL